MSTDLCCPQCGSEDTPRYEDERQAHEEREWEGRQEEIAMGLRELGGELKDEKP